jgi:hypothetical protein
MDFVNHLQQINNLFKTDDRMDLEHISLYKALFSWWLYHRNGEQVAICHKRMMRDSGIKSRDIYNITLIELDQFGYIMLTAPTEKGQACMVRMIILGYEKVKKIYVHHFRSSVKEDASVGKTPDDLLTQLKQLITEIIERIFLMKIHLEQEG